MDLLFKRYASPFLLVEETIRTGRFSEFVSEFVGCINEENNDSAMWEYWLHKEFDKSYAQFLNEINKPKTAINEPVDFEATIKESYSILDGFVPD